LTKNKKSRNQFQQLQQREESLAKRESDKMNELEMKENSIKSLTDELYALEEKQKKNLCKKKRNN